MDIKAFVMTLMVTFLVSVSLGNAEIESPAEELFSNINVTADTVAKTGASQQAVRSRQTGINFDALLGKRYPAGADKIKLSLFDDAGVVAVKKRLQKRSGGNYTWFGNIPGYPMSSVVIVVEDGIMAGNISFNGQSYQLRHAGNNTYLIHEIDQERFPKELPPLRVPPKPDSRNDKPSVLLADDGSTIDVMVVYTPAALSAEGGLAAMNALIQLGVDETNQSYANSQITQRVNLAHKAQVDYTESGDFETDLIRLTNTSDGYMDEVHTWRDTYGADLVSLWIEGTQYCGIAWLMQTVSTAFASHGFSVIARSCATGYYSFGHEMGHNMGAGHDWYVNSETLPYTYAHGYVYPSGNWRTIMAYSNACSSCIRVQYWSNPDVLYSGVAMGIPEGQYHPADNSRVLDNTAYTVANFRQSVCASLPVRISQTAAGYATIQSGYDNAATNQTIMIRAGNYAENLGFSRDINVTLIGGYDCAFTTNTENTSVTGSLVIRGGRVTADNLIIM